MTAEEIAEIIKIWNVDNYYSNFIVLPDGQIACVARFAFTHAVLSGLTAFSYADRWCYKDFASAAGALREWAQNYSTMKEPTGWHRHPSTGRRVRGDGVMYVAY